MSPVVPVTAAPEFEFRFTARVNQWLLTYEHGGTQVNRRGQPEKEQQANDCNNPDGTNIQIESVGQTEKPARN